MLGLSSGDRPSDYPPGNGRRWRRRHPRPSDRSASEGFSTWCPIRIPRWHGYRAASARAVRALVEYLAEAERSGVVHFAMNLRVSDRPYMDLMEELTAHIQSPAQPHRSRRGERARPGAQARLKALIDKGLGQPGDAERHLGRYTANYGK